MFVIVESPTEPETAGASAELQALGGPRPPPPPLDGPQPSKAYLAECALAQKVFNVSTGPKGCTLQQIGHFT